MFQGHKKSRLKLTMVDLYSSIKRYGKITCDESQIGLSIVNGIMNGWAEIFGNIQISGKEFTIMKHVVCNCIFEHVLGYSNYLNVTI